MTWAMALRALASAALLLLLLSGCSASQLDVRVADNRFEPDDTQLAAGISVLFAADRDAQNQHQINIHKAGKPLDETLLDHSLWAGDEVDFKFLEGGTYHVWCAKHGNMTDGMHMVVKVD